MRSTAVWVNSHALARTLHLARAAGAAPEDLQGAERALFAAEGRPRGERFCMVIQQAFRVMRRRIREHARHVAYTQDAFAELIGLADEHGVIMFDPEDLARELGCPLNAVYSVMIDLESEAIGAIERIVIKRRLLGARLTDEVFRRPAPKPRRKASSNGRASALQ